MYLNMVLPTLPAKKRDRKGVIILSSNWALPAEENHQHDMQVHHRVYYLGDKKILLDPGLLEH